MHMMHHIWFQKGFHKLQRGEPQLLLLSRSAQYGMAWAGNKNQTNFMCSHVIFIVGGDGFNEFLMDIPPF